MKRFVGFIIAIAGIAALVAFKTFKFDDGDRALLDYFKDSDWLKELFNTIKEVFKNGSKEAWLTLAMFAIGIVGLPLCLLLAGLCKKFGRFFWGLLAVGCCVLGVLVMTGKMFNEYSGLYYMFNPIAIFENIFSFITGETSIITPFIGYYAAGGCGLILMIMPIVWRD